MNQNDLRDRVKVFMNELHLSVSSFAKNVGFERLSYYRWIKGEFDFSEERVMQIDEFLKRFSH